MKTQQELIDLLESIDGKGYGAYKRLKGAYRLGDFTLFLDYIQGDPFASPSKARLRVPAQTAGIPSDLYQEDRVRRTALEDYLARMARKRMTEQAGRNRGSGKSGGIFIDAGGQEVLERSACRLTDDFIELRLELGLPAKGRKILGRSQAREMLCEELPRIGEDSLLWERLDADQVIRFVECVENQEQIRRKLREKGLIAFVADGALLARESGASDRPLNRKQVVPFRSPDSMRVTFRVPNPVRSGAVLPASAAENSDNPHGENIVSSASGDEKSSGEQPVETSSGAYKITGMGIPQGITLIAGGGYHGKSTLLQAIERSVYPHIPGDGREYVVSEPDLVKIRAEDGRRVEQVDIAPFISTLPGGIDTRSFCSDDASGSTSQAANISEALEIGVQGLLLDEDTSATNFMIRDSRMQALIEKKHEPITPFIDRVRELYETEGVSTLLVMGGAGDYFEVADRVILMRNFLPMEKTREAGEIVQRFRTRRKREVVEPLRMPASRQPRPESMPAGKKKKGRRKPPKIRSQGVHTVEYQKESIDLRFVEQLVDSSQTRAVAEVLRRLSRRATGESVSLGEFLAQLEEQFDETGVDVLGRNNREEHPGNLARPRRFEIAAALNRFRSLTLEQIATRSH